MHTEHGCSYRIDRSRCEAEFEGGCDATMSSVFEPIVSVVFLFGGCASFALVCLHCAVSSAGYTWPSSSRVFLFNAQLSLNERHTHTHDQTTTKFSTACVAVAAKLIVSNWQLSVSMCSSLYRGSGGHLGGLLLRAVKVVWFGEDSWNLFQHCG